MVSMPRVSGFIVSVALLAWPLAAGLDAQKGPAAPRHNFSVEIDGVAVSTVREVSGLSVETEVAEVRDGGSNEVRKVPGRVKFPNVTLTRVFTSGRDFYDWAVANLSGKGVRKTVTITMTDLKGAPVAQWTLNRAFPAKWSGPELNASGQDVAIETLELAHDGVAMSLPKK